MARVCRGGDGQPYTSALSDVTAVNLDDGTPTIGEDPASASADSVAQPKPGALSERVRAERLEAFNPYVITVHRNNYRHHARSLIAALRVRSVASLKPWVRIPERRKNEPDDPEGDNNPAILDFTGHGDVVLSWRDQRFEYGILGCGNPTSGKGARTSGRLKRRPS